MLGTGRRNTRCMDTVIIEATAGFPTIFSGLGWTQARVQQREKARTSRSQNRMGARDQKERVPRTGSPTALEQVKAGFYVTCYLVGSRRLVGVGVLVSIMGSDHHSRDLWEFFCTRQSGSQSLTEWHLICNCLEKCIHTRRIRKRRHLVQHRGPSSTIGTYQIDHHSPSEMCIRQKNSAQHISNRFLVVQIGLLL